MDFNENLDKVFRLQDEFNYNHFAIVKCLEHHFQIKSLRTLIIFLHQNDWEKLFAGGEVRMTVEAISALKKTLADIKLFDLKDNCLKLSIEQKVYLEI